MDEETKVKETVASEEATSEEEKVEPKKKKEKFVPKKDYDKLMEQFEKAMATAAHHQNLSKYYQSEYDKMLKYRSQAAIENLLPVIDSFELAFKFDAPTKEAQNYRAGFEFVFKMMLDSLKNEGLAILTPKVGDIFDGATQQIVETLETIDEKQVNKIGEVLLNGYMVKDRIIRPSSVKVYVMKKEENKEVLEQNDSDLKN